jgi:molecular chaperone HtpG
MAEEQASIKHGTIRTDFHGLIELLAKNLYPREDVFIRELVQNAHDAIVKRHAFEAHLPDALILRLTARPAPWSFATMAPA